MVSIRAWQVIVERWRAGLVGMEGRRVSLSKNKKKRDADEEKRKEKKKERVRVSLLKCL